MNLVLFNTYNIIGDKMFRRYQPFSGPARECFLIIRLWILKYIIWLIAYQTLMCILAPLPIMFILWFGYLLIFLVLSFILC